MGRPLNKKYFGSGEGPHFIVLANIEGETVEAAILKQTGTKRFVVQAGESFGTCYLVDADPEELNEGEMVIQAMNEEEDIYNVKVIKGRTAVLSDGSIAPWSFESPDGSRFQIISGEVAEPITPVITIELQPNDVEFDNGETISFTVAASINVSQPFTFTWQYMTEGWTDVDFGDVSNTVNGSTLTIEDMSGEGSGLQVRCVVGSEGAESVISEVATATYSEPV